MNYAADSRPTIRLDQIARFPQIRIAHDDIHSNCSICISHFTKDEIILILPCLHKFHRYCIEPWLSDHSTCPTCREQVLENLAGSSTEDEHSDDDEDIDFVVDSGDEPFTDTPINRINANFDFSYESSSDVSITSVNFSFSSEGDSSSSVISATIEIQTESGGGRGSDSSVITVDDNDDDDEDDESIDVSLNDTLSNSSSSDNMFVTSDPSDNDSFGDTTDVWHISDYDGSDSD